MPSGSGAEGRRCGLQGIGCSGDIRIRFRGVEDYCFDGHARIDAYRILVQRPDRVGRRAAIRRVAEGSPPAWTCVVRRPCHSDPSHLPGLRQESRRPQTRWRIPRRRPRRRAVRRVVDRCVLRVAGEAHRLIGRAAARMRRELRTLDCAMSHRARDDGEHGKQARYGSQGLFHIALPLTDFVVYGSAEGNSIARCENVKKKCPAGSFPDLRSDCQPGCIREPDQGFHGDPGRRPLWPPAGILGTAITRG